MMDLAMNFDADECLVTAMFDKGNRNDTMEAIDHIIPFSERRCRYDRACLQYHKKTVLHER